MTVHEYIIPHVLLFRQHNGDDPPQDFVTCILHKFVKRRGCSRFTAIISAIFFVVDPIYNEMLQCALVAYFKLFYVHRLERPLSQMIHE